MAAVEPVIRVQAEDFDLTRESALLSSGRRDIGAVVSFTGLCRDEGGRLAALELEHYPGMAEREIARICEIAIARWPVTGLTAIHRFGKIAPGGNIVLVLAASSHRQAAFDAANFVMDYLKTSAPFWKKEHFVDGTEGSWVSAKDADTSAFERWKKKETVEQRESSEFEFDARDRSVGLWSRKQMPLSPIGPLNEARTLIRENLRQLKPQQGEILHCVHVSPSLGRNDVENILIYNIGPSAFRNSSKNGLSFAFRKSSPPLSPSGQEFKALNQYYLAPKASSGNHIAAEFAFEITTPNSVFDIWWGSSAAEGTFYSKLNGPFGLLIELGSKTQIVNLGEKMKKLVDAIVASLHTDPAPDEIAIGRLAEKSGKEAAEIKRRFQFPKFPVLSTLKRPLVRPHIVDKQYSVQWFPEDGNCVECTLLPNLRDQSVCRVQVYQA